MSKLFIYPQIGSPDCSFFRFGGPGLANCMLFVARAVMLADHYKAELLRPTWERIGIGPILRREKDNRLYFGLFKRGPIFGAFRRMIILMTHRKRREDLLHEDATGLYTVSGFKLVNRELRANHKLICKYFQDNICSKALAVVPTDLKRTIAVHVRLGDFPNELRIPMSWYAEKISAVCAASSVPLDILLFSDGQDDELEELLQMPHCHRVCYGNAMADIVGMSRARLVVGSASTFSWWGAYLGQRPLILRREYMGPACADEALTCYSDDGEEIPKEFMQRIAWD